MTAGMIGAATTGTDGSAVAARPRTAGDGTTGLLAPAEFRVDGALPQGTTVLEASAGTGKTYTIAALATRYVAEGLATLPELMLVTFGREATQELRERVRERLAATERGLADGPAPGSGCPGAADGSDALAGSEGAAAEEGDGDDPVVALLRRGRPEEVAARRERLRSALAQFDAATIATTHQFCQQMLAGLGVSADADPDAEFVEHVDDLVTEVVDDFYVRKYAARDAGRPAFTRGEALELARRAVGDPQARLEPVQAAKDSPAGVRRGFAQAVRDEVERRKRARRLFSYDDMLTRLAGALRDPVRGEAARARLRERYRVVLVDEFQDTDPIQWEILRLAFHGHVTLVLIGDPKQAIYAFRGADVVSYLGAVHSADAIRTLGTNYRSDAAVLHALEGVFGEVALGSDEIVVRPVRARHRERRLRAAPSDAPLRLRVVDRDRLEPLTGRRLGRAAKAREVVAADLAADLAELLDSGAEVDGRRLLARDVAVLVRTNAQGGLVQRACAAAGVPAVLAGTTSVFTTAAATEWLTLLEAVEQPQRTTRLRAAALTCFVGHTVAELCGPDADRIVDELGANLRAWHALLAERGVAALLASVTARTGLAERMLALAEGERRLTDVRHIGQVLHQASTERRLGPSALVEWLRQRIADAARDTAGERSRRLESDADAVQVVTVHRSKGLEFPVVYVPFGWDRWVPDPDVLLLHDADGARVLDVGGPGGPERGERVRRHLAEESGEDLRLMYVALTRARCQLVCWWAPTTTTESSALHRLLVGRPAPGTVPAESYRVPQDASACELFRGLGHGIAVETLADRASTRAAPVPAPDGELVAAHFTRSLDTAWRRTSYSALTAEAHGHAPGGEAEPGHAPEGVASEPEGVGKDDESDGVPEPVRLPDDGPAATGADAIGSAGGDAAALPDADAAALPRRDAARPAGADLPSPMGELPLGTAFGTLVHAVFEHVDTTAPDLHAELLARCRAELARQPADVDPEALAAALVPVVRTPLGPLAGGRALAAVPPRDRLSELDFEMPLAGGDTPAARVVLGDLVPVLRRHLPEDDVLAGYPDLLAAPELAVKPLRGFLTGSIDAVLRVDERYLVVDYKTNWLGPFGPRGPEPLTAAHYAPPVLVAAMAAAHYPLQALLYSVALHRFLRWRLSGYSPDRHLGGVLYLFLRGMCGPRTPQVDGTPHGVFAWSPPGALVAELSDLLDRGPAAPSDRLDRSSTARPGPGDARWSDPHGGLTAAPDPRATQGGSGPQHRDPAGRDGLFDLGGSA